MNNDCNPQQSRESLQAVLLTAGPELAKLILAALETPEGSDIWLLAESAIAAV